MNYSNPSNLAVLACPGGERFADEIIDHLKVLYHRQFNRTVDELSKQYNLEKDDTIRKLNFTNDVIYNRQYIHGNALKYRCPRLKIPARFSLFSNGEIKAEIMESIRGKDLYIVQDVENRYPLAFNEGKTVREMTINDHLMTLFVTVDAAKQAGADRITLVSPVYPYSRQHKSKGREGLTASRVGKLLEFLGVDRIITLDIHSREIVNAFKFMRMENLHASYQIIRKLAEIEKIDSDDFVVVSPDTGAVDRNKFYATTMKKSLALLYKERDYSKVSKDALDNNISQLKLLGNVEGKTVFMADDLLGCAS